jgi:Secretion system C-terminal sorting domain
MRKRRQSFYFIIIPVIFELFIIRHFALAQTYKVGIPVCDTVSTVTSYAHDGSCGPFDNLTFRLDSTLISYVTGLKFQVVMTAVNGRIWSNLSDTVKVGDILPLPAPVASGRLTIFLARQSSIHFITRIVGTPMVAYESYFCKIRDGLTTAVCFNYVDYLGTGQVCQVQPSLRVDDDNNRFPLTGFQLLQNYPNPFNAATTIEFHLSHPSQVSLEIFNLHGEKIVTLVERKKFTAGAHKINWQAENLTSGVYFYHLRTNDFVETRKLILLK